MHELSIAAALIDQARAAMGRAGAHELVGLAVEIGALSGVDAGALAACFPLALRGTELAGATLELREIPVEVRCAACAALTRPPSPWALCCGRCGGAQITVVQGRDLILASLEVR